MKRIFSKFRWLPLVFLFSCAGVNRGCSSWAAQSFGADWVIVQYTNNGTVFKCWKLNDTSVTNEEHSDGIYWKAPSGHLVHISGWYNRVQVANSDWTDAAKSVGIDLNKCE